MLARKVAQGHGGNKRAGAGASLEVGANRRAIHCEGELGSSAQSKKDRCLAEVA